MLTNLHNLHVTQTFALLQICPAELEGSSQADLPGWPRSSGQNASPVWKEFTPGRAGRMETEPPYILCGWSNQKLMEPHAWMRQRCWSLAARACCGAWYVGLVWLGMSEGKGTQVLNVLSYRQPHIDLSWSVLLTMGSRGQPRAWDSLGSWWCWWGLNWKLSTLKALEGGSSCRYGTGWW